MLEVNYGSSNTNPKIKKWPSMIWGLTYRFLGWLARLGFCSLLLLLFIFVYLFFIFLFHSQNSADVNMLDYQKRSPLFYARIAGHEDCAQILIQNNCNEDIGPHCSPLSSEFGSTEILQSTTWDIQLYYNCYNLFFHCIIRISYFSVSFSFSYLFGCHSKLLVAFNSQLLNEE